VRKRLLALALALSAAFATSMVTAEPASAHYTDPPHCGVTGNGNNWFWGWCHTSRSIQFYALIHCSAPLDSYWVRSDTASLGYGEGYTSGMSCSWPATKDDSAINWWYH
jgi:hypothetical protein